MNTLKNIYKCIRQYLYYLKYRKDINSHYWYAVKEGYCQDETYNWQERMDYYFSDAND